MGRSRMQLSGEINGTGPVLTWAEVVRYPDDLPALSGMSGGPVFDEQGKIVGIMVAASVRRGRIHTVAPEILQATAQSFALTDASANAEPVSDVATPKRVAERYGERAQQIVADRADLLHTGELTRAYGL